MADDRFVFEDPRFAPQAQAKRQREQDEEREAAAQVLTPPPARGCMRSCLSGCLWIGLVLLILGGVAAYFIAQNWRKWTADLGSEAIKQTLEQSELPAEEKTEIGVEVDRLAAAFREGKISLAQTQMILELLSESPLATSLIVSVADNKYFANSGLSEEEKVAGRVTLRRFARGLLDNRIPEADRDATLSLVANRVSGDNWELRERVSDDELRAFLASAKKDADAAQIEDEPEVIDPSDELQRIVDQALGAGAPPAQPVLQ